MMSMMKEFRDFAVKGNVMDLAVGVIIGAAFGKIVDSVVKDLIMPIVGAASGGLDFSNYFFVLGQVPADFKGPMTYEALTKAGVPLFAYGSFITDVLNFIILAFIVFQMVRILNKAKRIRSGQEVVEQAPVPVPTPSEMYLKEIRDALVAR
jgi:large conductance mechanosensitive channel